MEPELLDALDEEQKAMLAKDYASIKKLTGLSDGQFATNHIVKAY